MEGLGPIMNCLILFKAVSRAIMGHFLVDHALIFILMNSDITFGEVNLNLNF